MGSIPLWVGGTEKETMRALAALQASRACSDLLSTRLLPLPLAPRSKPSWRSVASSSAATQRWEASRPL